jgi:hypothetical protein
MNPSVFTDRANMVKAIFALEKIRRMFEQHCGIEDSVAGLDRKILGTLGKSSNLLGLCEPPPQARDDLEKHHAGIVPSLDRFPITRKRFELSQG